MATLATIAAEYNMQPYELTAFLNLSKGVDYEAELDGEDAENIIEILEYDQKHNH